MDTGTIVENKSPEVLINNGTISVSHFWYCCYPGFNTQLIFSANNAEQMLGTNLIELFDCDGTLINSAKLSFAGEPIGVFDLECLSADCKLESGLKHGRVQVTSPAGVSHSCRLLSLRGGWIPNQPVVLTKRKESFYPLVFTADRSSYVALVNQSSETAEVRIRVFCGARAPKIDLTVPADGARIFSLDTIFPEYGYMDSKTLNAYVRVGVREGGSVSCLYMERFLDRNEGDSFRVVC